MSTTKRAGFEEQFDELHRIAYRTAYRLLGDRRDAEDAAQEALTRAYVRWPGIEAYAPAWTTRVAANLAIGVWRRRRSAPDDAAAVTDPALSERLDLVRALRSLPRRQREVVVLRYLADLPEADVAAALGCSVGSVKQHAHRGLAVLRHDPQLLSEA